jgi:hypothetical protein
MNLELKLRELEAAVMELPPDVRAQRPNERGAVRIRCVRTELLALLAAARAKLIKS